MAFNFNNDYSNFDQKWTLPTTPQPQMGFTNTRNSFNTPQNHSLVFSPQQDFLNQLEDNFDVSTPSFRLHNPPGTPLRAPLTPLNVPYDHSRAQHDYTGTFQRSHHMHTPQGHPPPFGISSRVNQPQINHPDVPNHAPPPLPLRIPNAIPVIKHHTRDTPAPQADFNKENTAAPGKAKGVGSRSGAANRRKAGGSDDELVKLGSDAKKSAGLKVPTAQKNVGKLTEAEGLALIQRITSEEVWPDFRLKAVPVFVTVCLLLSCFAPTLTR